MLPLLIRLENTETKRVEEYAFRRSPVRVGRNPLNDLALDLPFVSQWHAVVRFDAAGRTQYFDLGSTNGTLHRGRPISKDEPIEVPAGGTEVTIGALRIHMSRGPAVAHTMVDGVTFVRPDAAQLGHAQQVGEVKTAMATPGFVGRLDALHPMIRALRAQHDAYRAAWEALWRGARELLDRAESDDERAAVLSMLQEEFPAVAGEEAFRDVARAHRVELRGAAGAAYVALDVLRRFGAVFVPDAPPPATPREVRRVVGRLAAVIDAFGASFVALRRGHDQLQQDLGLPQHRAAGEATPVTTADDPRGVLAFLLDWRVDSLQRVRELTSTYADIMNREVALLNGMTAGVRALLQRLAPEEIERTAANTPVKLGPLRFARAPLFLRASVRWQQYVKRHREVTEEDRGLTAALMGREFARAYAAALGENYAGQEPRRLDSRG